MVRNQIPYFSKNCSILCTYYALSINNGDTIISPYDIANTFDNYFASIAETMKKSIQYSHKHFWDYLSNESSSTIFLQPTGKEESANISSLNSNKTFGPNSIPYRILFLLRNEISKQLADLFKPLFHEWCFSFCTQNCKSSSCF